jgi:recombination protein RecA
MHRACKLGSAQLSRMSSVSFTGGFCVGGLAKVRATCRRSETFVKITRRRLARILVSLPTSLVRRVARRPESISLTPPPRLSRSMLLKQGLRVARPAASASSHRRFHAVPPAAAASGFGNKSRDSAVTRAAVDDTKGPNGSLSSTGGGSLASRLLAQSKQSASFSSSSASAAKAKPAAKKASAKPVSKLAPAPKPAAAATATKASSADAQTAANKDAKKKALDRVLGEIDSNFGKGSIMKLGSASQAKVSTFPSGSMTLDIALGGGLPRGRIVEIYGPESSGKTTLALHAMAEMQKLGGTVALIDAEHAFDPEYSARLGLDVDEVVVCQPETGEMGLEVVDTLVRSNAVDLIVVDSVAALVPRSEIEGEIGMVQVGAHARLMSQALRKINVNAAKAGVTIIFLNQLRSKIGVIYGNPEITTGGNALKFYASVRLDIRRKEIIKGKAGGDDEGVRVKVKVAKVRVACFSAFPNPTRRPFYLGGACDCSDRLRVTVRTDYGDCSDRLPLPVVHTSSKTRPTCD